MVFARVLQLLQTNGSGSSYQGNVPGQDWLKKKHTIANVQEEIKKAQEKYNLTSQGSRVRKWLSRFSAGALYYGLILDVLVQHHPEYVSLAWGTTKLLFVVSVKNLEKEFPSSSSLLPSSYPPRDRPKLIPNPPAIPKPRRTPNTPRMCRGSRMLLFVSSLSPR
jgi:hypothetical protein